MTVLILNSFIKKLNNQSEKLYFQHMLALKYKFQNEKIHRFNFSIRILIRYFKKILIRNLRKIARLHMFRNIYRLFLIYFDLQNYFKK